MFKRLLSVGGFTLLSRITGFFRDVLMASVLGVGVMSDAFMVAFRFPNYFRAIFGEGTLNPAFLPRYAALRAKGENEAAARFGDDVLAWQLVVQAVLMILALAFMPSLMLLVAPGFAGHPGQVELAATFSRLTFPTLILTVVVVQLSAMLNANQKFWAAAAWSNFLNLAMIATMMAASFFPNAAFAGACGVLLGGVLELVFMLWASRREGIVLRIRRPRLSPEIKEFFKAVGAVTVGTASVTVAPFIDTMIASFLPAGSVTALYYGDRINQLPLGVLGIALGTVLLPEMSRRLATGDVAGADAAQNRAAAMALMLALPFVVVFALIPDTIMRAIFAHGAFNREAANAAGIALMAYGLGLPAMVLVRIAAATFYARHDTATPARATVTSILCNIAIKIALVLGLNWGIEGIALGTAAGAWINVAILTWYGRRSGLLTIQPQFRRALMPIFLATALTGLGAWGGTKAIGLVAIHSDKLHDLAALGAATMLGLIGYGLVVLVFRRRLPLAR